MTKHTILFLAANPAGLAARKLDVAVREIQQEIQLASARNRFEFVPQLAAQPRDLLHALRRYRPSIVHFVGHDQAYGINLTDEAGRPMQVSRDALHATFGAAGQSVQIIVLDGCATEDLAKALCNVVPVCVGTSPPMSDAVARTFSAGLYGALTSGESAALACAQGRAAMLLAGVSGHEPLLHHRRDVDPAALVLVGDAARVSSPAVPQELIDFTQERQRHVRFVGRDDLLRRLDEWLLGPGEVGWVMVTGNPGMGKSAILSAWLARREGSVTVPHHFIRRQVADWDQPEVVAISLAAQIEAAFPTLRDSKAKPERRLLELLGRVSNQLGSSGRMVVLVDGLDEIRAEPGTNPMPRFLPPHALAGIRFLCATRPTYPHLGWIKSRGSVRRLDLDDSDWAASNRAAVRGFWEAVAPAYEPPLSAAMITTAVESADGNVLHAVMLHDDLRDLPETKRRTDRIPHGLEALIGDVWDRAAKHREVRVGLGLLCAAREALSLDVLADLAGWSGQEGYESELFVRDARQLLLEEPDSRGGAAAYCPRHEWVRELIAKRLGAATVRAHHETLSRQLATWPPHVEPARRAYAVRHALAHRIAVGDWSGVRRLASDLSYLEARIRTTDLFAVEQELKDTGARCPDPESARDLADLARALARDSHWIRGLREGEAGTAGLIWNRLRRWGWTAEKLEASLPAEPEFLRVRYAASRESNSLVRTLRDHSDRVCSCAVTPDGRRVISASMDGTLKVWNLDNGRLMTALVGHTNGVEACAVTPDGRWVVSASMDGTLKVWNLDDGCLVRTLDGHTARVAACTITPDGRRVISASYDHTLKIWDLENGSNLATFVGHGSWVTACAVTPDGRHLVSASHDRTVRIWDLESGSSRATLTGHNAWVTACAVTPDGRRMVSASEDRTLKIWDLESRSLVDTVEGHARWVFACAVTPDGRRLVSASYDCTLKVWDLDPPRVLATFEGHAAPVRACAITPDGRRVVSASYDRSLKVWDLDANAAVTNVEGHAAWVSSCVVTPDGRCAVTASKDRTLKVWDLQAGRVLATLEGHTDWVRACVVAPDGRHLVSASDDHTVKVWDLETRRLRRTLEGHTNWTTACAVTPDGKHVISASFDRTLKVWELETGCLVITLEGHKGFVTGCAVMPDGRSVVSTSEDRTLKIWDLERGSVRETLEGHARGVYACAIAPDGRVISASHDHTLKIWTLGGGGVENLAGHSDRVRACAVTPDGRRVVSAAADRTLRVWDLGNRSCEIVHRGDATFHCVAATAEGIIAGDEVGIVWFLDWP